MFNEKCWNVTKPRAALSGIFGYGWRCSSAEAMEDTAESVEDLPIHVVIVTHNSASYIRPCLAALPHAFGSVFFSVTVVDNASVDETSTLVAQAAPWVRLMPLNENTGWARAINLAAPLERGHLLLLNPDTVPLPGSLETLVRALEAHPRAGAVGSALLSPEGNVAPESARAFPSLWREFTDKTGLVRRYPGHRLWGRYHTGRDERPRPVPVLSGAALLVRRAAWEAVGGLDERFWLYAGDTDLCRRLWQTGWTCLYWPRARVLHHGSGSVSSEMRTMLGIEALDAMYTYFRKHHGRAYAFAYRLMIGTLAVAKLLYWGLRRDRHHLGVQARVLQWCAFGRR